MGLNHAISTTLLMLALLTYYYLPLYPMIIGDGAQQVEQSAQEDVEPVRITLPLHGRERWDFEDALVACLRRQPEASSLPVHVLKAMANEFTYRLNKHRDLRKAVSYEAYKETYGGLQQRFVSLAIASGHGRNARDLQYQRGALYSLYRYMNAVGYGCAVNELARMRKKQEEKQQ